MKLYGFWRSLATFRVRIALNLKGLPYEETMINLPKGEQFLAEYKAVNPQSVLPALFDGDGPPLFQSMAILEYLEETHPKPALLPADARGRARVRGLSQICVSDGHPLQVPRIRKYLAQEAGLDDAAVHRWVQHWSLKALQAVESHLGERETGRYCHGDAPTLADICVASQVVAARDYGRCDLTSVPTAMRIYERCMTLEPFARAHPSQQPGAPADLRG